MVANDLMSDEELADLDALWDSLSFTENNCGTGAGGFKPGNRCAKGGTGRAVKRGKPRTFKQKLERAAAIAERIATYAAVAAVGGAALYIGVQMYKENRGRSGHVFKRFSEDPDFKITSSLGERGPHWSVHHDALFTKGMQNLTKQVSPELAKNYIANFGLVISKIPEKTAERLNQGFDRVDWFSSLGHLRQHYENITGQKTEAAGLYEFANKKIWMDGGDDTFNAAQVYMHELMHALDTGPHKPLSGNSLSDSKQWQTAWMKEMVNKRNATEYASVNKDEGFAEFGRLVYGPNREKAKKLMPESYKFFEDNGLL